MKDSLSRQVCQYGWLRLGSMVVVLGLVVVTVQGTVLESSGGWITCPPFVWSSGIRQQERRQRGVEGGLGNWAALGGGGTGLWLPCEVKYCGD